MKFVKESMKGFCIRIVVAVALAAVLAAAAANDTSNYEPQKKLHKVMPQAVYIEENMESSENTDLNIDNEGVLCQLPSIKTNVKYFTDYRKYNIWFTPHYRLQQAAWTDKQGLRRFNQDYIVALGSYYSTYIGDRFKITLDSGRSFTVILGDGKYDKDCDKLCMYTPCIDYDGNEAANLLEFIIDKEVLSDEVYEYGSIEKLSGFEGNVVEMIYLGRDTSQDWDTYEYKTM